MPQSKHLNLLFFFAESRPDRSEIFTRLQEAFAPTAAGNPLPAGIEMALDTQATHDTLILQAALTDGTQTATWEDLGRASQQILAWLSDNRRQKAPWACSRIFHTVYPGGMTPEFLNKTSASLGQCVCPGKPIGQSELTPYGWLWFLAEGCPDISPSPVWQRDLLLIIPQDRHEKVQSLFLNHPHQGLIRIELYLHKCTHLARQHDAVSIALNNAISLLRQEMMEHLATADFNRIQEEPHLMEEMSRQLMRFLTQKATVEILLNSLRSNQALLDEHLARMHLESAHYDRQKALIDRQIEQIQSDLHNAAVVQDSAAALQDIQRGAEGSRFERASYLLGYTAALLAGISLFNSFLDIWSLVLENSPWMLPAAWLRIALSLAASIAIPLAAAWWIARRKWPALVASLVTLGVLGAMILVTVISNL
jgi:hypothetical protein